MIKIDPSTIAIPFGLDTKGDLIHISQAGRGKTELVCPSCRTPLIARKGETGKRTWHFAHEAHNCGLGLETAIHIFAKQTIIRYKSLMVPDYIYDWKELNRKVRFSKAQRIAFEEVIPEQAYGKLVPDLTCITQSGGRLYVEIVVTHGINPEKFETIRAYGIPVLRVDMVEEQLRKLFYAQHLPSLEAEIIEGLERKSWVYNPKLQKEVNRLRSVYYSIQREYQKATECLISQYEIVGEPVFADLSEVDLVQRTNTWDWLTLKKQV